MGIHVITENLMQLTFLAALRLGVIIHLLNSSYVDTLLSKTSNSSIGIGLLNK